MVRLIAVALFLLADGRGEPSLAFGSRAALVANLLPFATVAKGSRSGIREPEWLVLRSAPDWERLWERHTASLQPQPPLPSVDFSQEMVIAVFAGEHKTGGYRIEVTAIEREEVQRQLQVFFREIGPPPDALVTQALTQPYHIVKLKQVDLPVVFIPGSASSKH
jgi:hypothetical protein